MFLTGKTQKDQTQTLRSAFLHLRNLQFHGERPGISSQLQFPSAQEVGQRGGSDETQSAALDWIELSISWMEMGHDYDLIVLIIINDIYIYIFYCIDI